jgi:hypothetical protein
MLFNTTEGIVLRISDLGMLEATPDVELTMAVRGGTIYNVVICIVEILSKGKDLKKLFPERQDQISLFRGKAALPWGFIEKL